MPTPSKCAMCQRAVFHSHADFCSRCSRCIKADDHAGIIGRTDSATGTETRWGCGRCVRAVVR